MVRVEVVAKGKPWEWKAYYPDGCGYFFLSYEDAQRWEELHRELMERIDELIEGDEKVRKLRVKLGRLMLKAQREIRDLTRRIVELQRHERREI